MAGIHVRCLMTYVMALLSVVTSQPRFSCKVIPAEGCTCRDPVRPHVTCSGLNLTSVPDIDDENRYALYTLDVSSNRIASLQRASLLSMISLRQLSYANNYITNLGLPMDVFYGVRQRLQLLDLASNKLTQIPFDFLFDYPELTGLYLSGNLITWLGTGAFRRMPRLERLYLDNNPISRLDGNTWQASSRVLWMLTLSTTHLIKVKDIPLTGLETVQSISISNSKRAKLGHVYKWMTKLPLLKHIELKNITFHKKMGLKPPRNLTERITRIALPNNELSRIPHIMLSHFKRLRQLDLSENLIKRWESKQSLPTYLYDLDLSYNKITSVDFGALTKPQYLTKLDLRFNDIKELNWRVDGIDKMGNDFVMELMGNPWTCDCSNMWLKQLVSRKRKTHLKTHEIHRHLRCGPETRPKFRGKLILDTPKFMFHCLNFQFSPFGGQPRNISYKKAVQFIRRHFV